jgi:hypothetical protein
MMSTSDLDRVQGDLATIRSITGVDLPFERFDVLANFAIGCSALLPAVVGGAGVRSPWWLIASAVPFLGVMFAVAWRNYRAAHASRDCPHEKRKEYRRGVPIVLASVPGVVGFHLWATRAGAPAGVANGCVLVFIGVALLFAGLYSEGRRASVIPGIVAIVCGLLWPWCEYYQFWTLLWSATGLAMVTAAAVMHRQLAART